MKITAIGNGQHLEASFNSRSGSLTTDTGKISVSSLSLPFPSGASLSGKLQDEGIEAEASLQYTTLFLVSNESDMTAVVTIPFPFDEGEEIIIESGEETPPISVNRSKEGSEIVITAPGGSLARCYLKQDEYHNVSVDVKGTIEDIVDFVKETLPLADQLSNEWVDDLTTMIGELFPLDISGLNVPGPKGFGGNVNPDISTAIQEALQKITEAYGAANEKGQPKADTKETGQEKSEQADPANSTNSPFGNLGVDFGEKSFDDIVEEALASVEKFMPEELFDGIQTELDDANITKESVMQEVTSILNAVTSSLSNMTATSKDDTTTEKSNPPSDDGKDDQ